MTVRKIIQILWNHILRDTPVILISAITIICYTDNMTENHIYIESVTKEYKIIPVYFIYLKHS